MRPARRIFAVAAALALSGAAVAQDDAETASPPPSCATDAAPYRDFDFWVGDWDVTSPDGARAGENHVSLRANDCLILEDWTGAGGGTGMSLNFYDPAAQAWRQVWRSPGVVIDYTGGLDGDAMALEGTIAYAGGRTAPFRGRWTPQDDGSVLQEFWEYDADADDWTSWFVGVYRRR